MGVELNLSQKNTMLRFNALASKTLGAIAAALSPTLLAPTSLAQVAPLPLTRFRDTPSHWAAACIEGAGAQGLMQGYGDGSFRPERTMTRAEFAAVMVKAFPDAQKIRSAPNFRDVANSFWAKGVIAQAYERGFLVGYPNNLFQPNQAISRVQAIAILANATALPVSEAPEQWFSVGFVDYDDRAAIPTWANRAVFAATQADLIVNYPNIKQLRPNAEILRGEATALLCQARAERFGDADASLRDRYRVPPQYIANDLNTMRSSFAFAPEIDVQSPFVQGLAVVKLGLDRSDRPLYAYINASGRTVIPGPYRAALAFSEGLAAVQATDGRWGFINLQGQWAIAPQFVLARSFSDGFAFVQRDRQTYAFINPDGTTQFTNPLQGEVGDFSEGLIRFEREGKWGFLDKGGEVSIPARYDQVADLSEGLAAVRLNGKWGFINLAGTTVVPLEYEAVRSFAEGLAAARQSASGPWGYLDPSGGWAIAPQFTSVQSFSEGLAGAVRDKQALWGFIDRTGNFAIQPTFYSPATQFLNDSTLGPSAVNPFQDGFAVVRLGSGVGLIKPNFGQTGINGEYVRFDPIIFNDAEWAADGMLRVHAGGRWEASGDPSSAATLRGGGWGYLRVQAPQQLTTLLPQDLKGLPVAYATAVLEDIRKRHGGELPVINLQVSSIMPTTWSDCNGGNGGSPSPSYPPRGACSMEPLSGWQMVVESGPVNWVYYLTQPLTTPPENWTAPPPDGPQSLPQSVTKNIIFRHALDQKLPQSRYGILWAEATWLNNCLDVADPTSPASTDPCRQRVQSGWRVEVIDRQEGLASSQSLTVYHATLDGQEFKQVSQSQWLPPPQSRPN